MFLRKMIQCDLQCWLFHLINRQRGCQGIRTPAQCVQWEREGKRDVSYPHLCLLLLSTLHRCTLRKLWQRGRWVSAHRTNNLVFVLFCPCSTCSPRYRGEERTCLFLGATVIMYCQTLRWEQTFTGAKPWVPLFLISVSSGNKETA